MSAPLVLRLFANCVPVRGARRSVICDLQRHMLFAIPNVLYEIVTLHRDLTFEQLCVTYGQTSAPELEEYVDFLIDKQLAFWTCHPERFPELDLDFRSPGEVDVAMIDVDGQSTHDYERLVDELDGLTCKFLQIRCYAGVDDIDIERILKATCTSRLRGVDLTLRYSEELTDGRLETWCGVYPRLAAVLIHGAPHGRSLMLPHGVPLRFITRLIQDASACGFVHPGYFAIGMPTFMEAQRFNTCLNRKIAVDRQGLTCNCPAMTTRYGNTADVALRDVVSGADFREVWNLRKDDVEVCRDCEFRYVCVDCRAHLQDSTNPRSKPRHCSYDPYTASWGADRTVPARPHGSPV